MRGFYNFIIVACYFMVAMSCYAHDFVVDGLKYTIISEEKCEVALSGGDYEAVVNIPESVTKYGIKYTVVKIDKNIFEYGKCNHITEINIPKTVRFIEGFVTVWMPKLRDIKVSKENLFYSSKDGNLYNKNGNYLILCNSLLSGEFVVPEMVDSIGSWCFAGSENISKLYMSDNVVYIARDACLTANEIRLSENIDTLRTGSFGSKLIEKLILPKNLKVISELSLPVNVDTLYIQENVCYIEEWCEAPQKAFVVAEGNPYYCSENGILYTKDKKVLLECPHQYEDWLELPSTIERVGECAFHTCTNLTRVTLPEGLKEFGAGAFYYCKSLSRLTLKCKTPPRVTYSSQYSDASIFGPSWEVDLRKCDLYIPEGTRDLYYNAFYENGYYASYMWIGFGNIIEFPVVTAINDIYGSVIVKSNGNGLVIDNVSEPIHISVTTIGGNTVYNDVVSANTYTISLPGKNIYIVKIGAKTQLISL